MRRLAIAFAMAAALAGSSYSQTAIRTVRRHGSDFDQADGRHTLRHRSDSQRDCLRSGRWRRLQARARVQPRAVEVALSDLTKKLGLTGSFLLGTGF